MTKRTNGNPADVGLQLHQEIVLRHLPVHVQLRQMNSSVFLHRLDYVGDLIADGLERRPDNVVLRRERRQAAYYAAKAQTVNGTFHPKFIKLSRPILILPKND